MSISFREKWSNWSINSPEMAAMIGSSMALSVSDIPFQGPIAGVNVGYVDGKYDVDIL
jgi:polyribonucleotide nucleotidyltransferase